MNFTEYNDLFIYNKKFNICMSLYSDIIKNKATLVYLISICKFKLSVSILLYLSHCQVLSDDGRDSGL